MSPTARGRFDGRVIAGPHDGSLTDSLEARPMFGLERDSSYLYATLRDDAGDLFVVMRRFTVPGRWPARLLLRSSVGRPGIGRNDVSSQTARTSEAQWGLHDGTLRLGVDDPKLSVTLGVDRLEWTDADVLDVAGRDVGPGLQWLLPDAKSSMGYVSRLFRVSGTLEGRRVEGFAGFDEVYLAPGSQNYLDDPFTTERWSHGWVTWANEYDDGSIEAGHAAFGRDRFGFALRTDGQGDAVIGASVTGQVTIEDDAPSHVAFDIDGEAWEFVIDHRGRAHEGNPGPVLQGEGLFRRVGETRRLVAWCASAEVPAH